MTRQHFEAIASAVLSANLNFLSDEDAASVRLVIASGLAGMCAQFNPRFEAGRFITAATGRGTK